MVIRVTHGQAILIGAFRILEAENTGPSLRGHDIANRGRRISTACVSYG
jgi:hypothetical protein